MMSARNLEIENCEQWFMQVDDQEVGWSRIERMATPGLSSPWGLLASGSFRQMEMKMMLSTPYKFEQDKSETPTMSEVGYPIH
jgi:hypothetical protein